MKNTAIEPGIALYLELKYISSTLLYFSYALPHRGKKWSKKRTRRETDKMELMRSQVSCFLNQLCLS